MSFYKIKKYVEDIAPEVNYGTSEFSLYMYSLVKMIQPTSVVELGTGVGHTAFFAAQACKENNKGHVYSIDDQSQKYDWPFRISTNYESFLKNKTKEFELDEYITFINKQVGIDVKSFPDINNIDILFNDISIDPRFVVTVLTWLLQRKSKECYYIVDRGYEFYIQIFLQRIVNNLNNNVIPVDMLNISDNIESIKNAVQLNRFSIHNVLKPSHAAGNDSFSIIKIEENTW